MARYKNTKYARIRLETLEKAIAFYQAKGDWNGANSLFYFANQAFIQLDDKLIAEYRREFDEHLGHKNV